MADLFVSYSDNPTKCLTMEYLISVGPGRVLCSAASSRQRLDGLQTGQDVVRTSQFVTTVVELRETMKLRKQIAKTYH